METALALFTSGVASLAIVPVMMRLAPKLGMVDQPNGRKVHVDPIPRVGGWGIAVGAIAAILAWAPMDEVVVAYLFGVFILFVFGAWDDRRELGHYMKFGGQFLATLPIVAFSGLYVTDFPFVGEGLVPPVAAMALTTIALIGMTNAINHSDGLDGLAGGEAILSLVAMGFLAYVGDGRLAVLIAVAVIGGVFGFLRYNTHPAVVFMGDSGSQVIGFSLGVVAVLLTQHVDRSLSPSIVLLLLGLPVADILFVLYKRISSGNNWFLATKNHVHHRLMERGFTHFEAVVIIYSIQILFVASGILMRHAADELIVGAYLSVCVAVFGGLYVAERKDWHAQRGRHGRGMGGLFARFKRRNLMLVESPRRILEIAIPAYLVLASFIAPASREFAWAALVLLVLLVASTALVRDTRALSRRGVVFSVGALFVYLNVGTPDVVPEWIQIGQGLFFGFLAATLFVAIRFNPGRREFEFRITAMDYLIVFVLFVTLLAIGSALRLSVGFLAGVLVVLYAMELMIAERRRRPHRLVPASALALAILAARGLL